MKSTLIIDIGNSSAAAALVSDTKVTAQFRERIFSSTKPTARTLEKSVLKALDLALSRVLTGNFSIDTVSCFLSSPWSTSTMQTISLHQPRPFVITERFLDSVITQEGEKFSKSLGETTIIEHTVLDASIRGYTVHHPIGQTTKECTLTVAFSAADSHFLSRLIESIEKHVHVGDRRIACHAISTAVQSALRVTLAASALHIDVGEEVIELSVVGPEISSTSFPLGTHDFIRAIAEGFEVGPHVAESLLHLYVAGQAEIEVARKILESVEKVQGAWTEGYATAHDALMKQFPISSLYLTTDPFLLEFFSHLISPTGEVTSLGEKNSSVDTMIALETLALPHLH